MRKLMTFNSVGAYPLREERVGGRRYYVVPIVALVEGVHSGLTATYFYPAAQIQATAQAWNGVPLPVGHPVDDQGTPLSIHDGNFLERLGVGFVAGMRADGVRLRGEAWIDVEKARRVENGPAVLRAVESGQPLEISSCMFGEEEGEPGTWNGEAYQATYVNYIPDHVALLPGSRGACSIDDGCGIRANQRGSKNSSHKGVGMKTNLLAALGKLLVANHVIVAKVLGALEASLDDIKNELWNHVNKLDNAQVTHFLHAVYPESMTFVYRAMARSAMTGAETERKLYRQGYAIDAETNGIGIVGDPVEVRENVEYIPVANAAAPPRESEKSTFKQEEITAMDKKKEKIDALIGCSCTKLEEKDRAMLSAMSEEQLDRLGITDETKAKVAAANAAKPPEPPAAPPAPKADAEPPAAPKTDPPKTLSAQEYIDAAPAEVRSVLQRAVNAEKIAKAGIVAKLVENKNCAFSKEQLEAKPLDELQALARLAQVEVPPPDYSGQAGTIQANEDNLGEYEVPPMPTTAPAPAATAK